jgi:hypothetical protein
MKYEDRVVLFLDILGFQKIIDDTLVKGVTVEKNVKNVYDAIHAMTSFVGEIKLGTSKQVTQFSDSIVLSFKVNDTKNIDKLFPSLLRLLFILLNNNILCRGAISYGKLFHDAETLFGPALVEAYLTESKAALYPRVIIDKSIIDLIKSKLPSGYELYRFKSSTYDPILNIDTDDRLYLDYFNGVLADFNYRTLNINEYLLNLRRIIINGRRSSKPDIRIKYDWMKNKFNAFLKQLPNIIAEREIFSSDILDIGKQIKEI